MAGVWTISSVGEGSDDCTKGVHFSRGFGSLSIWPLVRRRVWTLPDSGALRCHTKNMMENNANVALQGFFFSDPVQHLVDSAIGTKGQVWCSDSGISFLVIGISLF